MITDIHKYSYTNQLTLKVIVVVFTREFVRYHFLNLHNASSHAIDWVEEGSEEFVEGTPCSVHRIDEMVRLVCDVEQCDVSVELLLILHHFILHSIIDLQHTFSIGLDTL
jgi:hypothetical protein